MGTGVTPQKGIGALKYTAAGKTRPEARLIPRNTTTYTLFGDGFWVFNLLIGTNLNHMVVEGVKIDRIAAILDDLTESRVTYQPWFRPLIYIPLVNRIDLLMEILSSIAICLTYATLGVFFLLGFAINLVCFMDGVDVPFVKLPRSPGHHLVRFQSLKFSAVDPTYRSPGPGSSNWIKKPHLIKLLKDIKRYLYYALRSSSANQQSLGTEIGKEERIASLYRTLIGNRTLKGTLPPPEWESMFKVLIYGPSFVPDDFMAEPPANEPSIQADHLSTQDQRAQAYVQPLIETIWHNLNKRKVFITREGHLGLADEEVKNGDLVSVFLGCRFPVVLRNGKLNRWSWSRKWNVTRKNVGAEEIELMQKEKKDFSDCHARRCIFGWVHGGAGD